MSMQSVYEWIFLEFSFHFNKVSNFHILNVKPALPFSIMIEKITFPALQGR